MLNYWDNKDKMLSDLACLRWKFRSKMCCYISIVNECNFRFEYLIRSCPKGCYIDLVFIYLNLPTLVVDRFEIFASVVLNIISIQP
jgi:hypothetical protein